MTCAVAQGVVDESYVIPFFSWTINDNAPEPDHEGAIQLSYDFGEAILGRNCEPVYEFELGQTSNFNLGANIPEPELRRKAREYLQRYNPYTELK